ncbi:hypothetical protein B0H13DRAFT_1856630 [Mycena leptocephala]|nr:hypothetical protein B0H13DRAFT_1856630 [Mycena leptocephala]
MKVRTILDLPTRCCWHSPSSRRSTHRGEISCVQDRPRESRVSPRAHDHDMNDRALLPMNERAEEYKPPSHPLAKKKKKNQAFPAGAKASAKTSGGAGQMKIKYGWWQEQAHISKSVDFWHALIWKVLPGAVAKALDAACLARHSLPTFGQSMIRAFSWHNSEAFLPTNVNALRIKSESAQTPHLCENMALDVSPDVERDRPAAKLGATVNRVNRRDVTL